MLGGSLEAVFLRLDEFLKSRLFDGEDLRGWIDLLWGRLGGKLASRRGRHDASRKGGTGVTKRNQRSYWGRK